MAIPIQNTDWNEGIGAQMIDAATGLDFSGTVLVYITIDDGIQALGSVGSGVCASEGNGFYTYRPVAVETNGKIIYFTFKGSGAVTVTNPVATMTLAQQQAISNATTSVTQFSVASILTLALKRINVVQAGGTATGEDLRDAFDLANLWLDSLSTERLMIPFIKRTLWDITSTKGTPSNPYTIGHSGDIDIPIPSYIDHVTYINNGVTPAYEIPLTPITADGYAGITIKEQTATLPSGWYFQPTYASGLASLYLWAIPTASSLQGVLYHPSALTQFTGLTQTVTVPAGYKHFFVENLAVQFAGTFRENLPIDPGLVQSASAAMRNVRRINVPSLDMSFDPAITRAGYKSNIYTGWP